MADDSNGNGGDHPSATISYSIKELLDGIKTSIDRLYGKLDTKADRSELVELSKRVNDDNKRIDALETTRNVESRVTSSSLEWKRWVIPVLITLAMLVISIIQLQQHK